MEGFGKGPISGVRKGQGSRFGPLLCHQLVAAFREVTSSAGLLFHNQSAAPHCFVGNSEKKFKGDIISKIKHNLFSYMRR